MEDSRKYLEDYIFERTQDQLREKLAKLKNIQDMYLDKLQEIANDVDKTKAANPEDPRLAESLETQLKKTLTDDIYNALSKEGLLTREIQSDLLNHKLCQNFGGLSGHAAKMKSQLEQAIKRMDSIIEPVSLEKGTFDENILQVLSYNELKGAREILNTTFSDFLQNRENIHDQRAMKELLMTLDENGLVTNQMLEAYARSNFDKMIQAKDSLMGKIDKEISGLDHALEEHYGPRKNKNPNAGIIAKLIIAAINSVRNGLPKPPPKDPRLRDAYYPNKASRRTLLPIWLYFFIPYGLPILAAEMIAYKVTGYDRRNVMSKHSINALNAPSPKEAYADAMQRLQSKSRAMTYQPEYSSAARRAELREKAQQAEAYSRNIPNAQSYPKGYQQGQ